MWSAVMLSSTGRSLLGGSATRPRQAVSAKRAAVAMAERRVTAQSGERLSSTTLFTGHVRPQDRITTSRATEPWRRALGGTISRGAPGPRRRRASSDTGAAVEPRQGGARLHGSGKIRPARRPPRPRGDTTMVTLLTDAG